MMSMKGRPRLVVAPCRYCNKEFKRQEHLDRHLRTHTRERPFGCACGRMFSRLDLLSRHRRLSQCSGSATASIPHDRVHRRTDHPNQFVYQPPLAESTVIPTSLSHNSHRRGSSFSCSSDLDATVGFEGDGSELATQASVGHHAMAEPARTTENAGSTEYSQKQLMGKFSIYDFQSTSKDQIANQPRSCDRDIVDHSGGSKDDRALESSPNFMNLQLFDIGFLANETEMLNEYLTDIFPPMDCQQPILEDIPRPWGGSPEFTTPRDSASLGISPLAEPTITSSNNQFPAIPSTPNQTNQTPNTAGGSLDVIDDVVATSPWTVSAAAYEKLTIEVSKHSEVLPNPFALPSRQTLSRYVASWMRSFHPHLPFIHIPTTRLESKTPMLVLTLAATGSFYGFEHTHGYAMYFIAKSIISQKLEQRRRKSTLHLLQTFPRYAGLPTGSPGATIQSAVTPHHGTFNTDDIELLQSLLVLVLTMSWLDGPLAQDALAMSSQLAELTREALQCPISDTSAGDWSAWAREEEKRRTVISAYFVINIITICFNIAPQITSSEVNLPLPSSEAEFKAPSAQAWLVQCQKSNPHRLEFQNCLQRLLSGKPLDKEGSTTEFGNYMLVQMLLVEVYFKHQAGSVALHQPSLPSILTPDIISMYDNAFGAWQSCWDSAMESALDPSSPHGPLAFNSTAILRLAHIHLAVGLHSQCALRSRDPRIVAQAFEPERNPIPLRSPHLDQAIWHAICALRIPVRVGIAFVARGRTGHWSVQHAISNFACALLLTHWLENLFQMVSSSGIESLRQEERRLLSVVEQLVEETHLEGTLGSKDNYPYRIRRLAIAAVTLWGETCKGIQVFEIVHVVGETLSLVADSLESRL